MPVVFVSHSSIDSAAAAGIRESLRKGGFDALFLDFDERDGLHPGSRWRDDLSARIRTADAVVFLGSSNSQRSIWCAAELGVAKVLEKAILPMQIEAAAQHELLGDEQWINFDGTLDVTVERLIRELLRHASATARHRFWDASRCPFPGLRSFEADDAGVFFGRDVEIKELAHLVDPVGLLDHTSIVVISGQSGTGKSSLLRAGLIPALRDGGGARHGQWRIVPPLAPGPSALGELRRRLVEAGVTEADARTVTDRTKRLSDVLDALKSEQAGITRNLIAVDQAEEFARLPDWLPLLELLAEGSRDGARCRVVMTMREGTVSQVLNGRQVEGRVISLPLGPLTRTGLASVIEGPAARAGVVLEPGLAQAILDQVPDGSALPLLAMALQRSWDRATAGGSHVLTVEGFEAGGGIIRAIVEQIGDVATALGPKSESLLAGLLSTMATSDDTGGWVRRWRPIASLSDVEVRAVAALESARLVVRGGDEAEPTVTVSHAAVFTAWAPLNVQLESHSDDLRMQRRLEQHTDEWERGGRSAQDLPSGERLENLLRWAANRPTLDRTRAQNAFVIAANATAARARRRRLLTTAALAVLAVVAAGMAVAQNRQAALRSAADRSSLARGLMSQAAAEPKLSRAVSLASKALANDPSTENAQSALGVLAREPAFRGYLAPAMPVPARAVAWTAGSGLVVGVGGGSLQRWDGTGHRLDDLPLPPGTFVRALAVSPSAVVAAPPKWVAAGDTYGHILVFSDGDTQARELGNGDGGVAHVDGVAGLIGAGPDSLVSVGLHDGVVAAWDMSNQRFRWRTVVGVGLTGVTVSADGSTIQAGTVDGDLLTLDADGNLIARTHVNHAANDHHDERHPGTTGDGPDPTPLRALGYVGDVIIAGDAKGAVWRIGADGSVQPEFVGGSVMLTLQAVDNGRYLSGSIDGIVRLLNVDGRELQRFVAHTGSIRSVRYDPDTEWFAAASDDGLVSRWQLGGRSPIIEPLYDAGPIDLVGTVAGNQVIVGGEDRRITEIDLGTRKHRLIATMETVVSSLAVDTPRKLVIAGQVDGGVRVLERETGRVVFKTTTGTSPVRVAVGDGYAIAAGKTVLRFDLQTFQTETLALPSGVTIDTVAVEHRRGGRAFLGGGSSNGTGRLLTWPRGTTVPTVQELGSLGVTVTALAVSPDDQRLAVGRNDLRVDIWHIGPGPLAPTAVSFVRHTSEVWDVAFDASSTVVLSVDGRNDLYVWSAEVGTASGYPIWTGMGVTRSILISDETVVAVGRTGATSVDLTVPRIMSLACRLAGEPCDPVPPAHVLG